MKLTQKLLRTLRIFNAYDYANGHPYIYYRAQQLGRGYQSAAWLIHYPGHKFKDAHWRDHGSLAFDVFRPREEKQEKLLEAQEKFKSLFDYEELAKTPFGTWMEKGFIKDRNKTIEDDLNNTLLYEKR